MQQLKQLYRKSDGMTADIFDEVANTIANLWDAFHHLVSNDNFHWQPSLENLFASEKSHLTNLVASRDWLIVTVLQQRHGFTQGHDSVSVVGLYSFYSYVRAIEGNMWLKCAVGINDPVRYTRSLLSDCLICDGHLCDTCHIFISSDHFA